MVRTNFLDQRQKELDAAGYTIRFLDKDAPTASVEAIVQHAIVRGVMPSVMPPTIKVNKEGFTKKYRKQHLGSGRSIEDLYLLCKHYHPTCSIYDVQQALQKVANTGKLKSWYCSTHRKRMFTGGVTSYTWLLDAATPHYGIIVPKTK